MRSESKMILNKNSLYGEEGCKTVRGWVCILDSVAVVVMHFNVNVTIHYISILTYGLMLMFLHRLEIMVLCSINVRLLRGCYCAALVGVCRFSAD